MRLTNFQTFLESKSQNIKTLIKTLFNYELEEFGVGQFGEVTIDDEDVIRLLLPIKSDVDTWLNEDNEPITEEYLTNISKKLKALSTKINSDNITFWVDWFNYSTQGNYPSAKKINIYQTVDIDKLIEIILSPNKENIFLVGVDVSKVKHIGKTGSVEFQARRGLGGFVSLDEPETRYNNPVYHFNPKLFIDALSKEDDFTVQFAKFVKGEITAGEFVEKNLSYVIDYTYLDDYRTDELEEAIDILFDGKESIKTKDELYGQLTKIKSKYDKNIDYTEAITMIDRIIGLYEENYPREIYYRISTNVSEILDDTFEKHFKDDEHRLDDDDDERGHMVPLVEWVDFTHEINDPDEFYFMKIKITDLKVVPGANMDWLMDKYHTDELYGDIIMNMLKSCDIKINKESDKFYTGIYGLNIGGEYMVDMIVDIINDYIEEV
jgi:hypothetical protein